MVLNLVTLVFCTIITQNSGSSRSFSFAFHARVFCYKRFTYQQRKNRTNRFVYVVVQFYPSYSLIFYFVWVYGNR